MKQHFADLVRADKKRIITCCITTALLCWITHGYSYANATFFHDRSMSAFSNFTFNSAERAKWMAQYWDYITYFTYLPWLFGILVTIFFIISVYLIVNVLDIYSTFSILLIAGILVTRNEVIAAHLYWPHEILAALPLCLVSTWIWKQETIPIGCRMLVGMIFVGLSFASYGAYTSVAPFIVIIALVISMVEGVHWQKIFRRGLEYVITFLLGMAFYYVVLRLFLHIQGISLLSYANESRLVGGFPGISELLSLIFTAYKVTLNWFTAQPVMRWTIFSAGVLLIGLLLNRKNGFSKPMNVVLLFMLFVLTPLCAGSIWVMSFGAVHGLMTFSYEIIFVLFIALLDKSGAFAAPAYEKQPIRYSSLLVSGGPFLLVMFLLAQNIQSIRFRCIAALIGIVAYSAIAICIDHFWVKRKSTSVAKKSKNGICINEELWLKQIPALALAILLSFTLYQGVLTANLAYNEADRVDRASKSIATRMMMHIESCEGFTGTETLVFAGDIISNPMLQWEAPIQSQTMLLFNSTSPYASLSVLYGGTGFTYSSTLPTQLVTNAGCNYEMAYYAPDKYTTQQQEQIEQMPLYPIPGSIQKIDGTIIIKIGDI